MLLTHSSVDGYLYCFQVLGIVDNAAMDMQQISLGDRPSLQVFEYMPSNRIADHMVLLFFIF